MSQYRIRVEKGADQGMVRPVPAEGLSLGRSAQNDVVFHDALLSRRHCRLYVENGVLYVSDLATVNGTQVNGVSVREDTPLSPGAVVTIGSTQFAVSDADGAFPEPGTAPAAATPAPAAAPAPGGDPVDLGFGPPAGSDAPAPRPKGAPGRLVVNVVLGCVAVVLIALAARLLLSEPPLQEPPPAPPPPPPLEFNYVREKGGPDNIVRYELTLAADGTLSVSLVNLAEDISLRRASERPLSAEKRDRLAALFASCRFADLRRTYEGAPPENAWEASWISALLNGRAMTVEVRNTDEPADLRRLREEIETFASNELSLWVTSLSRQELEARAEELFVRGRLAFDQRDARPSALFEAARDLNTCVSTLDPLKPRPPLHAEAVALRDLARRQLDERVRLLNGDANIASNNQDWEAAAAALQEILDSVPDETDPRYADALPRLRTVQQNLQRK